MLIEANSFVPEDYRQYNRDKRKKVAPMKNITINIPAIYDENIQKLIKQGLLPSRSEAIRTALREFLHKEYINLSNLGFFEED